MDTRIKLESAPRQIPTNPKMKTPAMTHPGRPNFRPITRHWYGEGGGAYIACAYSKKTGEILGHDNMFHVIGIQPARMVDGSIWMNDAQTHFNAELTDDSAAVHEAVDRIINGQSIASVTSHITKKYNVVLPRGITFDSFLGTEDLWLFYYLGLFSDEEMFAFFDIIERNKAAQTPGACIGDWAAPFRFENGWDARAFIALRDLKTKTFEQHKAFRRSDPPASTVSKLFVETVKRFPQESKPYLLKNQARWLEIQDHDIGEIHKLTKR